MIAIEPLLWRCWHRVAFDAANDCTIITLCLDNDATPDAAIWLSRNHAELTAEDFIL